MKLEQAIVVVTGANRGLGRALVDQLLAAGVAKIYAGARDPATLAAVVAGAGARVVPLALDVTDGASLAAAAARATDATVLVNNAGLLGSGRALAGARDALAHELATNVFGLLDTTRAFLPALERAAARGPAGVVNILSVASLASVPMLGGYSATKAAAFSLSQALRSELAARKIAVHAVFPGTIDTDMVRDLVGPRTSPEAVAAAIVDGVARGVEDIAPDPMSRELFALWQRDPLGLERLFAAQMA